jgi:hypothetical protein
MGVPVAVATLGLAEHVLSAGAATAIVVAALASIGTAAVGVQLLVRGERDSAYARSAPLAASGESAPP